MKPALSLGAQAFIAPQDLRALDVIGWNLGDNPSSVNFSALLAEAKQELAKRIGVTTSWLDANSAKRRSYFIRT